MYKAAWVGLAVVQRRATLRLRHDPQAQHVAEAAIEERNAARKARRRADEAVAESEAAVFKREQLEAKVADLRRALSSQQVEESTFSSESASRQLQRHL